jgi:hypothetical protein
MDYARIASMSSGCASSVARETMTTESTVASRWYRSRMTASPTLRLRRRGNRPVLDPDGLGQHRGGRVVEHDRDFLAPGQGPPSTGS